MMFILLASTNRVPRCWITVAWIGHGSLWRTMAYQGDMLKVFVQKEATENPIGCFWGDPIDLFWGKCPVFGLTSTHLKNRCSSVLPNVGNWQLATSIHVTHWNSAPIMMSSHIRIRLRCDSGTVTDCYGCFLEGCYKGSNRELQKTPEISTNPADQSQVTEGYAWANLGRSVVVILGNQSLWSKTGSTAILPHSLRKPARPVFFRQFFAPSTWDHLGRIDSWHEINLPRRVSIPQGPKRSKLHSDFGGLVSVHLFGCSRVRARGSWPPNAGTSHFLLYPLSLRI